MKGRMKEGSGVYSCLERDGGAGGEREGGMRGQEGERLHIFQNCEKNYDTDYLANQIGAQF